MGFGRKVEVRWRKGEGEPAVSLNLDIEYWILVVGSRKGYKKIIKDE